MRYNVNKLDALQTPRVADSHHTQGDVKNCLIPSEGPDSPNDKHILQISLSLGALSDNRVNIKYAQCPSDA